MARLLTLVALGLAAALAGIAAAAAGAPAGTPATATSTGYAALLPAGTQGAVTATSSGAHERSASVGGLRPAGGGSVAGVEVLVGAAPDGTRGIAEGTIRISGVTLLDGRISLSGIRMSARATAAPGGAEAGLTEASVEGLTVDGRAVAAGPGSRVEVPGIGTLVLLESVADGAGGLRANALRVEVTDPQAASMIGQPFVIGHLDLSADRGRRGAGAGAGRAEHHRRAAPSPPRARARRRPAAPRPRPTRRRRRRWRRPPRSACRGGRRPRSPCPRARATSSRSSATSSFSDDYGAPRAVTGWHHGNDIFAATGTPVLAVADGTLSRVGINTLGGNRLWLTDEAGNEFYYAHLSAYAPATVSGARVRAGQVIAFVGNTGQAITTPPHLHFEVHPRGGDSVNPYPYLMAWRRGTGIPLAFRQAAASPSPAPSMGAVLVDGTPELDEPTAPDSGLAVPVS